MWTTVYQRNVVTLPQIHSFVCGSAVTAGGDSRENPNNSKDNVVSVRHMCGTNTNGAGCVGRRFCDISVEERTSKLIGDHLDQTNDGMHAQGFSLTRKNVALRSVMPLTHSPA